MILTDDQIRAMMPNAGHRLDAHLPFIALAMESAAIDDPRSIAAFMAQLAHESGEYRDMEEIWGPTPEQRGYEGRADLGNSEPGDGYRFRGRAGIGLTGRANYRAAGQALGVDLESDPDKAASPQYATRVSCWFWNSRRLTPLALLGWFTTITKIINGGFNGLQERWQFYERNLQILSLDPVDPEGERDSVIAFQKAHGLTADGAVGPITRAAAMSAV